MKGHCHCGLKEHFQVLKMKKLGFLGALLMVLHLLFHVVECLILPAILVAFSQPSEAATAVEPEASNQISLEEDQSLTHFYPSYQSLHDINFYSLKEYNLLK